jgi:hypothetical protein
LIICEESGNKLRGNAGHVQIFCYDLLANSITDPNGVCELRDCSATVFLDECRIFSTFSVVLLMLGHPEGSSSSTYTRSALKRECHSKTAAWLKECSPKASQSISSASVADLLSFMQSLMQTSCSILPSIADKMKHDFKKALV